MFTHLLLHILAVFLNAGLVLLNQASQQASQGLAQWQMQQQV
jgi:hypothetical protein